MPWCMERKLCMQGNLLALQGAAISQSGATFEKRSVIIILPIRIEKVVTYLTHLRNLSFHFETIAIHPFVNRNFHLYSFFSPMRQHFLGDCPMEVGS